MTFSLVIFLYLYYAFLVVWAVLSLIGVYRLVRFGGRMFGTFFVGFIYLAGSMIIIFASYILLSQIDWTTQVSIFTHLGIFNNLNGSGSNLFQ